MARRIKRITRTQKRAWQELARMGGKARAAKLTPEERRASAIKASKAAAKARRAKAAAKKRGD